MTEEERKEKYSDEGLSYEGFKARLSDYYSNENEIKEAIENDTIIDTIFEIADNQVWIYYYDIINWFAFDTNRLDYVNQAISEFGTTDDIWKTLQMGMFICYEQNFYEHLETLKEELKIQNP